MKSKIVIVFVLVVLAIAGRLLPHVWNATPLVAVSLLAGYVLPRKWAIIVPLVALLLSDLVLGGYNFFVMMTVYVSFAFITWFGSFIKKIKPHRLIAVSLSSSVFFFFTTNFAVWVEGSWYPKTAAGLMFAYEMGIPFFRNMALGDLIFTAVIFSAWVVVEKTVQTRLISQDKYHYGVDKF